MAPALNRRVALGAGLASLMPAPPPARFLATVAAVRVEPAAATPSLASPTVVAAADGVAARATPDPIFEAIETAGAAEDAFRAALINLDEDDAVALRAADEAADRSTETFDALLVTRPTTFAWLVALVRYLGAEATQNDPTSLGGLTLTKLADLLATGPPIA